MQPQPHANMKDTDNQEGNQRFFKAEYTAGRKAKGRSGY
jgi:hypothetical protein